MTTGQLLLCLCVVVLLSIAGSAYAHVSQERRARLAHQIRHRQVMARQLSEAAHAIEPWCQMRQIPAELAGMAIKAWRDVLALDPHSPHAQTELAAAEALAQSLAAGKQATEGPMHLTTSEEISNLQRHLRNAEAIFSRLSDTGGLAAATCRQYRAEIRWLILRAEVESLMHQGDLALGRNDRVRFNSFYQRALNQLKKSQLADPRRNEYIRTIADRLSDREQPGHPASA